MSTLNGSIISNQWSPTAVAHRDFKHTQAPIACGLWSEFKKSQDANTICLLKST